MKENEKLERIKKTILNKCKKMSIGVQRIILFGSRARGENRENSDFDIYVVVDEIDFFKVRKLYGDLQWALVKLEPEVDLVIRTKKHFEENKKAIGFISYYVNKEGKDIWIRK